MIDPLLMIAFALIYPSTARLSSLSDNSLTNAARKFLERIEREKTVVQFQY